MSETSISPSFPYTHQYVSVHGSDIAYISSGPSGTKSGPTALFLHSNPTSSYLWRNIIPHISRNTKCIAPDLIGMGASDKPDIPYRLADHQRYINSFIDAVIPSGHVILVVHDWGSAIGLDWARRNESRVRGLVLMEFIRAFPTWASFSDAARDTFKSFRDPELGPKLVIGQNAFVEQFLPFAVVRKLSEEMDHYRAPFKDLASRKPVFAWPNELPIEGHPKDVEEVVEKYNAWLLKTDLPKLFFWGEPGGIIGVEKAKEYGEVLKNVISKGIGAGVHYLQEDNPHLIGEKTARWVETLGADAGA